MAIFLADLSFSFDIIYAAKAALIGLHQDEMKNKSLNADSAASGLRT